jgi:hypothetical protein
VYAEVAIHISSAFVVRIEALFALRDEKVRACGRHLRVPGLTGAGVGQA